MSTQRRITPQTGARIPLRAVFAFSMVVLLGVVGALGGVAVTQAPSKPDDFRVAEIAPRYHLISDGTANLVLLTSDDGSVLVGVPRPGLIAAARNTMARLGARPSRYVITTEDTLGEHYEPTLANGDGGWSRDGAITFMHEKSRGRMARLGKSGTITHALPFIGFSHVVQVYLADEEIHMIHERRGYSDSDLVVHFEKEGVLYLGNSFTTDGYPVIDTERRGSIGGMIDTAESFLRGFRKNRPLVEPIVPGRGPAATMEDLQAYRDVLIAVRDRVRDGIAAGRTKSDIIASKPTREFDGRWGHGPVTPDRFVEMVYDSVSEDAPATSAARHQH